VRLVLERRREARVRHLRFGWRDGEFPGDDGVLPASRLWRRNRSGRRERLSTEVYGLVSGAFRGAPWDWILAATPRSAMRGEGQDFRTSIALERGRHRCGNDSIPAADCGIHSGSTVWTVKMKKRIVVLAALAALLFCGGLYLWGPSKTPSTQKPLFTLSTANFSEFGTAFDEGADGARLVLLLSPT
jgi:hypothetical protein